MYVGFVTTRQAAYFVGRLLTDFGWMAKTTAAKALLEAGTGNFELDFQSIDI